MQLTKDSVQCFFYSCFKCIQNIVNVSSTVGISGGVYKTGTYM